MQLDARGGQRLLANGKTVSPLGFGCSSLWAKPSFDPARAREILNTAAALGVNHFDTGPSYGEGEARLGAFLAASDAAAMIVSTKVGTEQDGQRSFDPARMRRSLDGSLARLGVDRVDIAYLHGPAEGDLDTALGYLAQEKAAGRIDLVGVNSFDLGVVGRLVGSAVDVVMLQYSVADQRFAGLIERLHAAGKTVIAGTALGQGIYSPKTFLPRDRQSLWYLLRALRKDPLFAIKGRQLAKRLAQVADEPHAAAIRFAVSHPLVAGSLFGSTSLDHVRANVAAAARQMLPAERALLIDRPAA